MDTKISVKVQEYESFLNDTLKEDLKYLETKLTQVNNKLTEWYLLKKTICDLREQQTASFKTYVDLGGGISCRANVSDVSVVNVNIGLNIYVKMTLDDACTFCDIKINALKKEINAIQDQTVKVKAHIKLVLLGLQELQKI